MAKISNLDIATSGKLVRPAGHPDLIWLDPSQVIIVGEESEYRATGSRVPAASLLFSGSHDEPDKAKVIEEGNKTIVAESSDVPQLSDIENIQYIKYFDPVSKIEKAKAIIKIRNSSKNKKDIAGVDARIYQPRGL
jgi:hypothetical protein